MNQRWLRMGRRLFAFVMSLGMFLTQMTLVGATPMDTELDYSSYDPTGSIELDAATLWEVTDLESAVEQIRRVASTLNEQDRTQGNINIVMLGAEAAIARASTSSVESTELNITAQRLKSLLDESREVAKAVEEELLRDNIQIERNLSRTVTFLSEYQTDWHILITIEPDVAELTLNEGEVDKIRVEVRKHCAITFDLAGLQEDLKKTNTAIQIEMREKKQADSPNSEFEARIMGGVLSQAVTLSLSPNGVDWQNVKLIDRNAVQEGNNSNLISGYNQGFDMMDASSVITLESSGIWITFAPITVEFPDIGKLEKDVKDAIESLAKAGVVGGFKDGNFYPNDDVNRGQFSKFVMGVMSKKYSEFNGKINAKNAITFIDVPKSNGLYDYIEAAAYFEYVNGYQAENGVDYKFGPQNPITRVQIYAIMGRILKKEDGWKDNKNVFQKKYKQEPEAYLRSQFGASSVSEIRSVFWDDIAYATKRGLVIRTKNGGFGNPDSRMNRGDTALILWNLLNKVKR